MYHKAQKMMKTVLCLATISASIVHGMDGVELNSLCGDESWLAYKDEKCVKLFQFFQTRNEAEQICNQQFSTLVTIHSAVEQNFLTEYILNASDSHNVWIGAQRRLDSSREFNWNDGSVVQRYTNWGIGRPSDDARRHCVLMQSEVSRQLSNMPWTDIACSGGNWFICEKLQAWSLEHFQRAILVSRRDLEDSVNHLTDQLKDFRNNPIPIGFIYVQLQNQPVPSALWPTVVWSEITTQYAGLFFRTLGGNSAAFGSIQSESSPRLNRVESIRPYNQLLNAVAVSPNGNFSTPITSGGTGTASSNWGISFRVSAAEVRPRNTAMRIFPLLLKLLYGKMQNKFTNPVYPVT